MAMMTIMIIMITTMMIQYGKADPVHLALVEPLSRGNHWINLVEQEHNYGHHQHLFDVDGKKSDQHTTWIKK